MIVKGEAPEMEKNRRLTSGDKVELLYNNMIKTLETFEFDDSPFAKGMLCVIKPLLIILTAETIDDLQKEVDKMTFKLIEPCD